MTVVLTGSDLTLAELVRVARGAEPVELAPEAVERMRATRAVVEAAAAGGEQVYGLTTGVGAKKTAAVASASASAAWPVETALWLSSASASPAASGKSPSAP